MLKKLFATLVAVLLACGLSLSFASPATAAVAGGGGGHHSGGGGDGSWGDGGSWGDHDDDGDDGDDEGDDGGPSTPPAPSSTTLYGVGLYVYKKVDTSQPASWANSGPQRLLISDVDNTSKDANPWYASLDAALLPTDVCGPGWGVQQDKVKFTGSFSYPATITPPTDNIGWPPIYAAQHQELSTLVTVPPCSPPPPPPASCIATSQVSYGYDAATNSGVITVPTVQGSTGTLCSPFWVTATSWKYLGSSTWIQKLDQVQKLGPISASGSYPYAAAVTCGQGDIYASFSADDPTLSPTPYLSGPDDPFDEHFLHEMGFSGPSPTYMTTELGCNTLTAVPTSAPPSCTAAGGYSLPPVEHVSWLRDGVGVAAGDYTAATGSSVTITAVADESWVLPGGTQDATTHTWSQSWTFSFPAATDCAQAQLTGEITAQCVNDVPMLHYSVTLVDPDHQSTDDTAVMTLGDGTNSYAYPTLGTLADGETLTGDLLWPGATVDGSGHATGWPGWEFDGTTWQPTTGNFAWSRAGVLTATITVNPELVASVSYPPGDPSCNPGPPKDPRTLAQFPTNAQLAQQCTTDGRGILTLGQVDGVSFFEDVNYFVDGAPATASTVYLAPGSHRVTVTVKDPSDGLIGPTAWQIDVTGTGTCGDLTTLALTGVDSGYLAALAALLLAAGASIAVIRRVRPEA